MQKRQRAICLDLEGTLAEEIWQLIAKKTGIDDLLLTTRDIPDTKLLARTRVETVNKHGLKLSDLVTISASARVFEGAIDFLNRLQELVPRVLIATDLSEQLAKPYLEKLGYPAFFGQSYATNKDEVVEFIFRQENHKQKLVEALKSLNSEVFAAGDSYNDIPMLKEADAGFLFRAPEKVKSEYPQFKTTESYDELLQLLTNGV